MIRGSCHCGAVQWQFEGMPESVAHIPIDHFEGLEKSEDLPRDGRCVEDYWF